jgi:preprotein translocase subunit YajC
LGIGGSCQPGGDCADGRPDTTDDSDFAAPFGRVGESMQTDSLHGYDMVLTLAQAAPQVGQPAAQVSSQSSAPASQQALVPVGIPAAARPAATTGTESQPLPAPNTSAPAAARGPGDFTFLAIMVGFLLLMIFMAWSGNRKEKKKREELNSSIGKGDTVQTIGGIIGEIAEMRENEVILRVEDGRIRFARSAIQGILKSKGDKSEGKNDGRDEASVEPKLAATAGAR